MNLQEDKQGLVDLILWYKNDYFKNNDDYFDEMIRKVWECEDQDSLELYQKIVDGWIDY